MINSIVAVDQNWAIGNMGQMLFHLPADLARFKQLTSGSTIFMGRKTLESLPSGKPLANRRNIVLTTNKSYTNPNVEIAYSFRELFDLFNNEEKVFNIGGAHIYTSLLDYSSTVYVSKVLRTAANADRYFPNLDINQNWKLLSSSGIMEDNDIKFKFLVYENLYVKKNNK